MRIALFGNMQYPESEGDTVERLDIHAPKFAGTYDQVVVSNTIPELPRDKVMAFLEQARSVLNQNGELIVHVPMAEFACKKIFTNKPDNMTFYMLYGNDATPFRACYSLLAIRTLVERAGFAVRKAAQDIIEIRSTTGETTHMPIHFVVGVRHD